MDLKRLHFRTKANNNEIQFQLFIISIFILLVNGHIVQRKTFSSVFSSKTAKCINKDINTLKIERIRNNENPLDFPIVAAT